LPFCNGKGSKHDCCNYRGITLLSVPGKAFARTVLTRVKDRLVQSRRIQQSGFTRGRSTIERIATLNMLHQTGVGLSKILMTPFDWPTQKLPVRCKNLGRILNARVVMVYFV